MEMFRDPKFFWLVILVTIWDLVWKGIALWKSARNGQRNWFVVLLLINSLGIVPIIYLQFFQKKNS